MIGNHWLIAETTSLVWPIFTKIAFVRAELIFEDYFVQGKISSCAKIILWKCTTGRSYDDEMSSCLCYKCWKDMSCVFKYLQRGQIFSLFIKISFLSIFACILPVPSAFWLRDGILLILSGAGLPRLCWTNKETATLSTSNLLLPQIKKMGLMRKEWNWDTSHFEPKTCFAVGEKKSYDMQPEQTRAINVKL